MIHKICIFILILKNSHVEILFSSGPEESEPGTADTSLNEADTSLASQSGPNYAFVDPTTEDTMIVQFVLGCRTATREIIEEEEGEEEGKEKNEKEEVRIFLIFGPLILFYLETV